MGEEVREEACGRKWVSGERRGRREWGNPNEGADRESREKQKKKKERGEWVGGNSRRRE